METGIHRWVVIAGLGVFCILFASFDAHRSIDGNATTSGITREKLAVHNLELTALREIIDGLPQEPACTDGSVRAQLPDGTNIVRHPSSKTYLAKPWRVAGGVPLYAARGSATLTVTKTDDAN